MPNIYYITAEGKFGATYLWFIPSDRFFCYRSTSCWLCTALPSDCSCFPGLGMKKEAKRGCLRWRKIISVGPGLLLWMVIGTSLVT